MTSNKTLRGLGLAAAIAVTASLTAPVAFAAPGEAPQATTAKAKAEDFNGDGYRDVAVAAPGATVNGKKGAGYVAVLYGSKSTALPPVRKVFHQDTTGIPDVAEVNDSYGSSLSAADLDGDGYTDLVVGASGESVREGTSGALSVIWGGRGGLSGSAVLKSGAANEYNFGAHLVTGDIQGDGAQDVVAAGYGTHLVHLSGPFKRDGSPASVAATATEEYFGIFDLAAGDLNRDGRTDVAAVRHYEIGADMHGTHLWAGGAQGLLPGAPVKNGANRFLGNSLDIGDVNKDGYEDLVVGRGYEGMNVEPATLGGVITYIPGSARGPVGGSARVIGQNTTGVPGTAEVSDGFGNGLSVGDIDGDGYADVSTGVPSETIGKVRNTGAVVTLRGGKSGLTGAGAKVFSQDTAGVPGTAENYDRFGFATKLVDLNNDKRAELVVSALNEDAGAGAVWILRATKSGITAKGAVSFGAKTLGTTSTRALLGAYFNN
ncbi:FG-GAP-like repeat-containing protein [Streptomyces sp. CAU 1734]|uniref:FG-GAP-like repeat-containing protein n=1 Tax=Streptomyces sp. CAU 1734 TaxID=3140360 RepID=UPI003260F0A2